VPAKPCWTSLPISNGNAILSLPIPNPIMSQSQAQWLFYAIASGGCAALNGVFAKLTTTQLTTTWATAISHLFGLSEPSRIVELLFRGVCNATLIHQVAEKPC